MGEKRKRSPKIFFAESGSSHTDPFYPSELIEIPIGKNGGEIHSLRFDTTGGNSPHALIIGGTGSGKSNLLHAIILSGAYRYSPRDLQIYLIDFKGGVEFKFYEADKVIRNQLSQPVVAYCFDGIDPGAGRWSSHFDEYPKNLV